MKGKGAVKKPTADRLLLKKYPNRRLYDTEQSSYVTLGQVEELVKQGREIRVIDAKTEEDVTGFVLSQIIIEEARNRNALLPVSLLHLIIQYGETVLDEFFEKYLELAIIHYLTCRNAYQEQFRKWLGMGIDLSVFNPHKMGSLAGIKSFLDLFPQDRSEKTVAAPDRAKVTDLADKTDTP